MKLKEKLNLRHEPAVFHNRELAFYNLEHCVKPHIVMLGDYPQYWVVCPADGAKLFKLGYEYAV